MSDNMTNTPIMENEHVKEFLSIMKENGKDLGELTAFFSYVTSVETQLSRAVDELQAINRELHDMREERNHPVRTALQNTAQSLEANITETRSRLNELKTKIIEGCKNAVSAFKQRGISALSSITKFFRIKPALQSLRNSLQNNIKADQDAIAKIEAISRQYHSIGWAFRNLGRAIIGKKTVRKFEPNGKLSELMKSPFQRDIKRLTRACNDVDKAIAALERLEKAAPQKTVSSEHKSDKPSTRETMKTLQKQIDQKKKDTPVKNRSKQAEAAL